MNAELEVAAFAARENVRTNIQHSTFNIQKSSKRQAPIKPQPLFGSWILDLLWMLDVGFWMFTISSPILPARARSRVAERAGYSRPRAQWQSGMSPWLQKGGVPPLVFHQRKLAFPAR